MSGKPKYELKDARDGMDNRDTGGDGDNRGRRSKKGDDAAQPVFKTEEMLKQEARDRLIEQDELIAKRPPQSERRKKIDNFFFHYKWHTILVCVGAVLLAVFIRDTVFRPKPDLTVVVATSRFITQAESDALQAALESYAGDFNEDGRVLVNLDMITLPIAEALGYGGDDVAGGNNVADGDGDAGDASSGGNGAGGESAGGAEDGLFDIASVSDPEMLQASMMKLTAIIAAWSDTLFLMDDDIYDYIAAMAGPSPFDDDEDGAAGGSDGAASGGSGAGGSVADGSVAVDEMPDYAIFEALSGIHGASGAYLDRLAIGETALASEPGFEYMGELAFSLRPPPNTNEKNVSYFAYCMGLLNALAAAKG
ncbi:MAG: hypothetical protein FWH01_04675 [Oscillospiraceae bacterium]|nr:hypothetical protein [Oscillospiraceae bacterium]